jgi:hypothetical protein
MTGCALCGGYGMHHDPIAHSSAELAELDAARQPAPDPSPEEQAVIDRFGIFAEEDGQ